MSKEILRPVFAGMGLLASLALVGCGGSGQTRPGTGGTTGNGGSSSTGGSTGTGGAGATTGSGGTGGAAMALPCTSNPTEQLITNFGSAAGDGGVTPSGMWGTTGQLTGTVFGYPGTMKNDAGVMSSIGASIDKTSGLLKFSGTVNPADYAGGGMAFGTCVNTTNWTGIQFTLGGTSDGCNITFQLQTESQEPPMQKGTCTASSCYDFPQIPVTIPTDGSATVIHFIDLTGTGMPASPSDFEKEMFGLQWQFTSATPPDGGVQVGCKPMMTISNVMWTTN
jgi:hypothetical protein